MDAYTVELIQNGVAKDITKYVSDFSLRDDTDAYSVDVSFSAAVNPKDHFLHDLKIEAKDGITLKNKGQTIWEGFVTTRTKAGQITCRDKGFYFKSDITVQFNSSRADDALSTVCKQAGVTYNRNSSLSVCVSGEYIRQQASSVIDDILEQVSAVTNQKYIHRIIDGKFCVRAYDSNISTMKVTRPVSMPLDITWALGEVEVESSMDDMATNIIVQTDENDKTSTLANSYNKQQASKYGYITKYITVDSDQKGTANAVLASAIQEYGSLKETARVPKIWGSDAVLPGTLLYFNSPAYGLSGKWWVTSVTHTYAPYHTMSLELLQYYIPKAVAVTTSAPTQTTTTKTLLGNFKLTFYAGDTSTASGKKPTVNHTIAVDPKVIPLGTQVYIDGWGTYTAEDTGGAIKGKIIDIFVASNAIARQYGVKYANVYKITATTTTTGSVSSLGQKMVNIALKEEGYRESGNNNTKYGAWFGYNGVAWCAIFVCWCANQAGVSTSVIPKVASVSSLMSFAKSHNKWQPKGNGYRPTPGDILIQKSAGASHTGIVVKSDSSRFYTIEGNSSNRVAQRNYSYSDSKLTGFFTPWG